MRYRRTLHGQQPPGTLRVLAGAEAWAVAHTASGWKGRFLLLPPDEPAADFDWRPVIHGEPAAALVHVIGRISDEALRELGRALLRDGATLVTCLFEPHQPARFFRRRPAQEAEHAR